MELCGRVVFLIYTGAWDASLTKLPLHAPDRHGAACALQIDKEAERQAILAGITDGREAGRLNVIFGAEREEAKRRLLAL